MIGNLLSIAAGRLAAMTDSPQLEADILLAYLLQVSRASLHAWPEKQLTAKQIQQFENLLTRRLQGEPIAYLVGYRSFWSFELEVTPDTLIPRPETELLVELALTLLKAQEFPCIADLGTGSGAIALAIAKERPYWQVTAVDQSKSALVVAEQNAKRLAIQNVRFCHGNWCEALPQTAYDLIVSNPPYISTMEWLQYQSQLAYEPQSALLSDEDGLMDIRLIIQTAKNYLKSGGYLLLEHGFQQAMSVQALLQAAGYCSIQTFLDLNGQPRVTQAQYLCY